MLENVILMNNWYVDYDYILIFDMEMMKGRVFFIFFFFDSFGVIINEKVVEFWGDEDLIGKMVLEYDN